MAGHNAGGEPVAGMKAPPARPAEREPMKHEIVQRKIEMVEVLPLWMQSAPHSGPRTSRDAAADIKPHAATLRQRVLVYIAGRGAMGATSQEVELDTGLAGNTVRPRLCELRESGCIEDSGTTRKTVSGRQATVWRFKP